MFLNLAIFDSLTVDEDSIQPLRIVLNHNNLNKFQNWCSSRINKLTVLRKYEKNDELTFFLLLNRFLVNKLL